MFLLVGLGNIGSEYELTRHNFGFLLLDKIVDDYGFTAQSKKFKSEVFSGTIANQKVLAIKPQTYMNRSGTAVIEAINFYKIDLKNVIVFHDDLDLPLGKVKVKIGGGHAGHNGLRSIDECCGKDYWRLRLGIGRPQNQEYETADYVLGRFSVEEMKTVEKTNLKISDLIEEMIEGKVESFMNKFHL